MKKIVLLLLIVTSSIALTAQENMKNEISTTLFRLEKNSQTLENEFNPKFFSGLEYQRIFNKWSIGLKYEHGLNRIDEECIGCADHFYGIGYLREDNIYLTARYNFLSVFSDKLLFTSGLGLYYSSLNFSGDFQGGFSGGGSRKDNDYMTFGITPSFAILYYPINQLYISLNTNLRIGFSEQHDKVNSQKRKTYESVLNAPELRIGFRF